MYKKITKLFAFLLVAVIPFWANAQNNSALTDALNQQLIPLRTVEPDTNFSDLEKLKIILKDKKIIGIGETTHGTHEFFTFKHRMLEFLVKEMGVKTFVIEADFAGTQQMNDFVLDGKGSVEQGIEGTNLNVWNTKEVADMANWLKAYNETQSLNNKVSFWGCDVQGSYFATRNVKEYLSASHQLNPVLEQGFKALQKYWRSFSKDDKAAIKAAINELYAVDFTHAGADQAAIYKRDVRQIQQFADYVDGYSKLFPARQDDVRDKYMTENCEWIYNHTGGKKMMIWAHNGHISKSSGNQKYNRMGMQLSKLWGDAYYAMGFDFYDGAMRSLDMKQRKYLGAEIIPAVANSTGDVFSKCRVPNFVLDLKSAATNPLIRDFISTDKQSGFYSAGYTGPFYIKHRLADAYDAVIFIRHTTPAQAWQSSQQ